MLILRSPYTYTESILKSTLQLNVQEHFKDAMTSLDNLNIHIPIASIAVCGRKHYAMTAVNYLSSTFRIQSPC